MDALASDLARIVGMDAVTDEPADRSAYAHDLWPRQLIATRGSLPRPGGPRAIVWPTEREQLAAVLDLAARTGTRVIPFGAGSAVTGALSLEDDVIAVDTKRMRTLHSVDLARGLAVADAGILGEHLEEQLLRRGATLGHYPSSIYCSTLGGWIATRSAGQCSGRYGKIEDMVISVDGVLPTGESIEAGPPEPGEIDARALLVGSEGLFGFLTRATVRIWPAPTTRRFAAFGFRTMPDAWNTIRAIYQAGLRPAVARLYDPFDAYIFKSGGRSHERSTRPAGRKRPVSEYVLRHLLSHPGWINRANETLGDAVFGLSLLVLMFEGTATEGLDEALARTVRIARERGAKDEGEALARRWLERRHAVSYRQPPTFTRGLWVDTMEVGAPWSRLGALYDEVHHALGQGGFVMAHMSHAYPDGCSIYFTFAGSDPTDALAEERYLATWQRALRAANHAGGTISHHHGVGRSKRSAMRLELAAGVDVIDALTRAADPRGIVVRGALVPGTEAVDEPLIPDAPPPPAIGLDGVSRIATVRADVPLAELHAALECEHLTLDAPREGTVAEWLARRATPVVSADPVDHLVAGYVARLANGRIARTLPVPRGAAGPDLFPLFAAGRGGELVTVSLRVRGEDEIGPAWHAPVDAPAMPMHPAVRAWIDRMG